MGPQELNLAQGAILSQFFIIAILFVGGAIMRRKRSFGNWNRGIATNDQIGWWTLFLAILTIGSLLISDAISANWESLFHNLSYQGIAWRTALRLSFLADLVMLFWFVYWTGGSVDSPFQPLWFLVPTLALFLQEPTYWVVIYATLATLLFSVLVYTPRENNSDRPSPEKERAALCAVSAMCVIVSTFIGIYTR